MKNGSCVNKAAGMVSGGIGFIGAGQMARALARGLVQAGLGDGQAICAYDRSAEAARLFEREIAGARLLAGNREVVEQADLLVLAVKPQNLVDVSRDTGPLRDSGKLLVSLLAGVRISALCAAFAHERIVRVMPNTPCLVGCGASAYALGPLASPEDGQRVERLLSAVGLAVELEEKLLDAVTGLSGSGPAYVYTVIEALSDGGVRAGLPRDVSTRLAAQTVLGAAQMVLITGEHPGRLKDRVASPGGTTIAGLQVLERRALRSALIDAVDAATLRSTELGKPAS